MSKLPPPMSWGPPSDPDLELDSPDEEAWCEAEIACEEYVELIREGIDLSISSFANRYPELRSEILDILPTVMLLEQARSTQQTKRRDGRISRGPENIEALADYRIISELGRGGMGIVYEAYQESLNRVVALKVLPRQSSSEEQVQKFFSEASIVAQLHHSNIVPVFTIGQDDGVCFYAMERLNGVPLDLFVAPHPSQDQPSQEASSTRRLSTKQVVDIGRQIASALQYAHENKIFHRDVKPSNLILSKQGRVWLTDFGLATISQPGQDVGERNGLSGTLRYVPPERLDGAEDAATGDIYSLGLTLIELLTGRPAFAASRPAELTRQVRAHDLLPLTRGGKKLPQDLRKILEKATSLHPTDRYSTARELHLDLVRFSQQRPVAANPIGRMRRGWRWCRQNVALTVASSLAILSLATVAVVSTTAYFQSQAMLKAEQSQKEDTRKAATIAIQAIDEIFEQLAVGLQESQTNDNPTARDQYNERTNRLLSQLTRFYEKLTQVDDEESVISQAAFETRYKVGRLYFQLGNYDDAIYSFQAARTRYRMLENSWGTLDKADSVVMQARLTNELGLAYRINGDAIAAEREHQDALEMLEAWRQTHGSQPRVEFALAKTNYLLAHRTRPGMGMGQLPPPGPGANDPAIRLPSEDEQRKSALERAIEILERRMPDLTDHSVASLLEQDTLGESLQEGDSYADQLQLLAMCYREFAADRWSQRAPLDWERHDRAVQILERLVESAPHRLEYQYDLQRSLAEIDVFDSRLDLATATLARSSLERAVKLGKKLLDAAPAVIDYQRELIHSQYKLANIAQLLVNRSDAGESEPVTDKLVLELDQVVEQSLQGAAEGQWSLVSRFPESVATRVWAARFALELAACNNLLDSPERRNRWIGRAQTLLQQLPDREREQPSVAPLVEQARRMSIASLANSQ